MQRMLKLLSVIGVLTLLLVACGQATTTTPPAGQATSAAPVAEQPTTAAEQPTTAAEQPTAAAEQPTAAAEQPTAAAEQPTAAAAPTAEPTPVTLGSGGQKIVIWHSWAGAYAENISKLLGDYATKNNVTLELLQVPDLNQKVNVAVPAGQGPDIIAWVDDQIGKNVEIGVIQPIDDKGIDKAYLDQNFVPTAAQAMVYKDKVYCVPESMEAISFVYNKDLVKESDLPKNTDELLQKAADFNKANSGKYYFVYQANGDAYHNAPWWYGFGAFYVKEDGTVGLDTPESVNAGNFLQKLSGLMPKEVDYDVSRALFTEGKAAIWMTGPWAIADIQKAKINFGVAPLPQVSTTSQPAKPFVGVKCMMLAQGAKNVDGALNLMKYYGSTEFQAALGKANQQVPANKAALDQVKSDPVIAAFAQSAQNGVPLPNTPFMDALWGPAGDAQKAIWTGAQPPDQALKDAAQVATQNVEQIK